MSTAPKRRPILALLTTLVAVGYPALVYVGLTRWSTRTVALTIGVWALLMLAWRLRSHHNTGQALRALLPMPIAIASLMALSAVLNHPGFILVMPVLINIVLGVGFALSLRTDTPVIERFARMQHPDLSPAEQRYCRSLTYVWIAFFALNGAVAGALAIWASLDWWALYTGLLAYVAIGALFAVERLVRMIRFPRAGASEEVPP